MWLRERKKRWEERGKDVWQRGPSHFEYRGLTGPLAFLGNDFDIS